MYYSKQATLRLFQIKSTRLTHQFYYFAVNDFDNKTLIDLLFFSA